MKRYPHFHLAFLPPNTTSISQPADIALQRPLKQSFRALFDHWCTSIFLQAANQAHALNKLFDPTTVKLDVSLVNIKHRVVKWLLQAHTNLASSAGCLQAAWSIYDVLKDPEQCAHISDELSVPSHPAHVPLADLANSLAQPPEPEDDPSSSTDQHDMDEQNGLLDHMYADTDDNIAVDDAVVID